MTPTGNPQNMLIAVASGLTFARFLAALALPSIGGLAIVFGVVRMLHNAELSKPLAAAVKVPAEPFDGVLVAKSLVVFAAALAGWLAGFSLPLVAITAAAILIAIAKRDPARAFAKVEWSLLLFFGALFVVMRGARDLPLVNDLTTAAAAHINGAPFHDATVTSAAMLALSNLISNVPAVILWLPVVPAVAAPSFVWLTIAMSSTFSGNLTLLGSMANLIVAERAEARGERLGFADYLRVGVSVTLLTMGWGIAALILVGR